MARSNDIGSTEGTSQNQEGDVNKWTLIIYHSGDADLGEEFIWAFKEMLSTGTPEGVEVVALMDSVAPDLWQFTIPSGTAVMPGASSTNEYINADSRVFDTKSGRAKIVNPKDWEPEPDKAADTNKPAPPATKPAPRGTANLASATVLRNFVNKTIQEHPANYYMLVLSGHGSGMIGKTFLRDQGAGYYMSVPSLDRALKDVVEKINILHKEEPKRITNPDDKNGVSGIDILGLDACGMMTAEVGYLLKGEVKYLIASQGFMTMEGWPYHTILQHLHKNPNAEPEELAKEVVRRCVRYYSDFARVGQSLDMAACELDKEGWSSLTEAIKTFGQQLLNKIKDRDNTQILNAIIAARWYAQSYASEQYVDLHDFCDQLMQTYPGIKTECENVINKLKPLVKKSCYAGAGYQQSYGVSLYFPWVATDRELLRYRKYVPFDQLEKPKDEQVPKETVFNEATKWGEFLVEFIKTTRREPRKNKPYHTKSELIFMPPDGYLDHFTDHRAGTPEESRAGTPEESRAGTPEESRAGTPEESRAGTPEESRAGTQEESRAGTQAESKGKRGFVKVKNVALEYYEDECQV